MMDRRPGRFLQFAINQILSDLEKDTSKKGKSSLSSSIHKYFSVASVQTYRCNKGHLITKPSFTYIIDVESTKSKGFLQSLEDSINNMKRGTVWCDQCKENSTNEGQKSILSLPKSLLVTINQMIPESNQVL